MHNSALLAQLETRVAALEKFDRLLFLLDQLIALIMARPVLKAELPQLQEILATIEALRADRAAVH